MAEMRWNGVVTAWPRFCRSRSAGSLPDGTDAQRNCERSAGALQLRCGVAVYRLRIELLCGAGCGRDHEITYRPAGAGGSRVRDFALPGVSVFQRPCIPVLISRSGQTSEVLKAAAAPKGTQPRQRRGLLRDMENTGEAGHYYHHASRGRTKHGDDAVVHVHAFGFAVPGEPSCWKRGLCRCSIAMPELARPR